MFQCYQNPFFNFGTPFLAWAKRSKLRIRRLKLRLKLLALRLKLRFQKLYFRLHPGYLRLKLSRRFAILQRLRVARKGNEFAFKSGFLHL